MNKTHIILEFLRKEGPQTKSEIIRLCGRRYIDKNLKFLLERKLISFDGLKFKLEPIIL